MLAALGRRRQRWQRSFGPLGCILCALLCGICTMTDGPQDGAAPAAAAQPPAEQQQQEQQVAAQVEQITYSLQDLLKKPEAE